MTTIETQPYLTIHEVISALERIEENYGKRRRVVKIEMNGKNLVVETTDVIFELTPDAIEEYR